MVGRRPFTEGSMQREIEGVAQWEVLDEATRQSIGGIPDAQEAAQRSLLHARVVGDVEGVVPRQERTGDAREMNDDREHDGCDHSPRPSRLCDDFTLHCAPHAQTLP